MKIFSVIFSFYLFGLSVMPCTDKEDCKYLSEQTASTFATTNHSDHDEDSENCPPFCICACCGQTLGSTYCYTKVPSNFGAASERFSVYTSAFVSEVYFNIWQPPKIS